MAYFIFKLVRMYASDPQRIVQYLPARHTLTAFAVMTILLLVITIVICVWCASNYGHGLKNHTVSRNASIDESNTKHEYYMDSYGQSQQAGYGVRPPGGSRMEID
jgi:hypothetical protein